MPECVILDMDGTLLDTEQLSIPTWKKICRRYGYEIPDEFIISFFGMNRDAIDRLFLDTYGPDFPMAQVRADRNAEGLRVAREEPVTVKPGAFELLEHLKARRIPAVLASGTELERAQALLTRSGIWEYLSGAVCGSMVARGKPEPDIFLEAARRVGADPRRSLVVEDSGNGARAGLAAGCHVAIVPDLSVIEEEVLSRVTVCPSLREVIDVVEEWNEAGGEGL